MLDTYFEYYIYIHINLFLKSNYHIPNQSVKNIDYYVRYTFFLQYIIIIIILHNFINLNASQ